MTQRFRKTLAVTGCAILAGLLAGCGGGGGSSSGGGTIGGGGSGGGGGGGNGGGSGDDGPTYVAGQYAPYEDYEARCEVPRPGTSDTQGSVALENFWLRSWSNETYLWYRDLPDLNPYSYDDQLDYFDLLKTNDLTASGQPVDRFHFTYDTDEYQQLVNSGEEVQYGAELAIIRSTPPRDVRIAFVQDGSPAGNAGVARGARILEVDGVDVVNGNDVDTINDGLFPSNAGESHSFTIQDLGSDSTREVTLTAQVVAIDPVQQSTVLDVDGDSVGYLHLSTFGVRPAEEQLIDAMTQFADAGIDDLVIDLRYNGGGFLDISAQLGYMVAGPGNVGDDFFEEIVFNDKHPDINPVTGETLEPTPFHSTSLGFSVQAGQPLPSLDFDRVFVLSTADTCSASEAIINALRGIDVEVVLIGGATCGKPYGFYATDNCGITYFTIQFRGENAKGFGDYADGFAPAMSSQPGTSVTGCGAADDFGHLLGDPEEGLLSTALAYRETGSCPGAASSSGITTSSVSATPWAYNKPELFLSDPERYEYIDPTSLYASERVRESLRRRHVRDLTLSRPGAGLGEDATR